MIEILEKHFEEIVDSKFSASLEEELDNIAQNKADYQQVLKDFYYPFMDKIEAGKKNIISQKVHEKTGQSCPKCGGELVKKIAVMGSLSLATITLNANMSNKLKTLTMEPIKNCVKNAEGKWCKNSAETGRF